MKLLAAVKPGPKVAGPDKPVKPAKPKIDKVYKSLPGIDLTKFTAKQKTTILERANKERCTCKCKLTVAGCRHDDSSCGTGKKLAKKIVEEVTDPQKEISLEDALEKDDAEDFEIGDEIGNAAEFIRTIETSAKIVLTENNNTKVKNNLI